MRKVLVLLWMAVFFAGSFAVVLGDVMQLPERPEDAAILDNLQRIFADDAQPDWALQEKLAKWYNLNLHSGSKDYRYTDAYDTIWNLAADAMGILEIPSAGKRYPIYHGKQMQTATGAGHLPDSAFPTGGEGNHCVLTGVFDLHEGDYFYIRVFHAVRAYQVQERKVVNLSEFSYGPERGADLCTLAAYHGNRVHLIHGTAVTAAPDAADIWIDEDTEPSDGWEIAAGVVLFLGILLVPLLFWCTNSDL